MLCGILFPLILGTRSIGLSSTPKSNYRNKKLPDSCFTSPPVDIEANLTRKQFESWIAEDIQLIADCVDGLLNSCNLQPVHIDKRLSDGRFCVCACGETDIQRKVWRTEYSRRRRVDDSCEGTRVERRCWCGSLNFPTSMPAACSHRDIQLFVEDT